MNVMERGSAPQREICAIDFGSKNFKFVTGRQVGYDVEVDLLKKEPMGLGKDLAANKGIISDAKLDQIDKVLAVFREECLARGVTTILGIGTSAIRSAKNSNRITKIIESHGITFEVAHGKREGEVAYLSVTHGAENQLVSDLGSRSFQYAFKADGEIHSASRKAGYMLAYDAHFKKADTFASGRKSFRDFLKKTIHNIPKKTDIYFALASNTMAAFVTGGAKLDVVDQFLMKRKVIDKVKYLRKLNRNEFKIIKANTPKVEKILPGLTFIEYMLQHSGHDKVMVVDVELPAGLIVEHFRKLKKEPAPASREAPALERETSPSS